MCDSSCLKKYWKTYPSGAMCSWKLTDPSLTKGSKTDDPSPPCSVPPHPPIRFDQSPSLRTLPYLRRGLCKSGTNYCCKGPGKQGHIVADTLLPMMFFGLRKLGTFVADTKSVFLNKMRNIFCVRNKCFARGQTGKHLCRQLLCLYSRRFLFRGGSRGGETGEFSPPLFLSPIVSFLSYPSNIDWF